MPLWFHPMIAALFLVQRCNEELATMDFWSTIVLVFVLLLVMLGAYFTTKFLSAKTKRMSKGRYIDIKDRMIIGRDKYIVLLTVGEQSFLVGVTNQTVSLIGTLKKEEMPSVDEDNTESGAGFKGFAAKVTGFVKNAGNAQEALRKARLAEKVHKNAPSKSREEQDEIDKILNAINQRKNKNAPASGHEGDGNEKG
jgi:flagellar biosynthetic protein FliO